jgi:hypothetical protein
MPAGPPWRVEEFHPARDDEGRETWVPYGPAGDRMPAAFEVTVAYADQPLRMQITATFDGASKVRARVVSLERTDGESVTAEDMASTRLASVMGTVVLKATKHAPGTILRGGARSASGPPTDEELLTLARIYWYEFVSWGKPRQAIMSAFDLPRSTASVWIRRARDKYDLPGAHSDA